MSFTIYRSEKTGFVSRWMRRLMRDVLEEHDRGRYVTIYSNRNPDERDVMYSPGAQWYNQQSRKRFALREIKAEWKEIQDEK